LSWTDSAGRPAPIEAVLVGAGQRGHDVFGRWALANPELLHFTTIADPDEQRRARFAAAHDIPPHERFASLEELLRAGRAPGAAVVATPDRTHATAAATLLGAGYDVLLEKPIATSLAELHWLVREAGSAIDRLQVVFELRYTAFYTAIHEIVGSGRLGRVVSVSHAENLAPWFMAHSYVRGNWGSLEQAAPAIVAKCSHDFDLLAWNAAASVQRISSFGSLFHFRPEEAPAGATRRCTDGCPVHDCPFDARRIYLTPDTPPWLLPVVDPYGTADGLEAALRTGPYGRCVYFAGSDVVDHQVVVMELTDGSTITLSFNGHSYQSLGSMRTTRYDGTRASLRASLGPQAVIEIHDHDGGSELIDVPADDDGHGGGDGLMLEAYIEHMRTGLQMTTNARDAIEAHILGFAAEEARSSGTVVDVAALRASIHARPAD
jgi:predicted dehydrogenase